MKSIGRTLIFTALTSMLLAPLLPAVEQGFIPLLDREHTTGWKQAGPGNVSMEDGSVTTSSPKGHGVFWYSPKVFNDFILKLEFRATQREFNSGVFIRFPAPRLDATMPDTKGNEVAIADGLNDDRPTGSIYHFQDSSSAPMKRGDWNEFEITCIGNRVVVKLNGKSINDFTGLQHPTGFIGLQCHSRGPVQFRNIRIKDLSASQQPLPILDAQPLTLDPKQPLLETFSQLAPNASAWVLAALDEGVPPNVRQNLTYLREDLLDEYKQKPKASQDAYKLAHQLCSTMIAALDERDQTLVRAGFRAVQADANSSTSGNQALNARRNYMMSWPQYAREESQRAELRSAAANQSQVMKEQPKVEWSTRTAALRRTLDSLYAQFREALRQSPATK